MRRRGGVSGGGGGGDGGGGHGDEGEADMADVVARETAPPLCCPVCCCVCWSMVTSESRGPAPSNTLQRDIIIIMIIL